MKVNKTELLKEVKKIVKEELLKDMSGTFKYNSEPDPRVTKALGKWAMQLVKACKDNNGKAINSALNHINSSYNYYFKIKRK